MTIQPWHWLVFGVVLMIGEMFVPTFALLWFGAAALVVALLTFIVPMSFFGGGDCLAYCVGAVLCGLV